MTARPFQVGDRVRITHRWSDVADEVHVGIVGQIRPVEGHPDLMNLRIQTDEPYTQSDGTVVQTASATLTLDCTAAWVSSTSVELLEPVPTRAVDPSSDAAVVRAALAWEDACQTGTLDDHQAASDKLHAAVRAWRAAEVTR